MEQSLLACTKTKFRYIVGHRKDEIKPGVMAEEHKFLKNLQKRIILPSERITNCQDGVVELD